MASLLIALIFAALTIKKGRASPTQSPQSCIQLEVPVSVDTKAIKWLQPRVDSSVDAVDWATYVTTWSTPKGNDSILGEITVRNTFKINGQLCVPLSGAKADILQLATHGVGFDKRYWDAEIKPKEYSYVQAVLNKGYSIFTYDRLGTGSSDKPDAYDVVQSNVQVEILRGLTSLARSGKLVSSSKKLGGGSDARVTRYKPKKIIHVGHSLGSAITLGLLSSYGSESDGAVATGFLYTDKLGSGGGVATWGFEFARENDPTKFKDRGSGYLVQATKYNVQISFLKKGAFEPALLDYAWEIRQPATVSEFLSLNSVLGNVAPNFKAPLQFVIGENDYGFCAGDCKDNYNITEIKKIYPGATALDVHIQPRTGHGLTLSTNATAGYKASFDFLEKVGL